MSLHDEHLFHWLRKFDITQETVFPNVWQETFSQEKKYVILNLKDGKRIIGWPHSWPNSSEKGHFALDEPGWIDENGKVKELKDQTSKVLIDVNDVSFVEFLLNEKNGGNNA